MNESEMNESEMNESEMNESEMNESEMNESEMNESEMNELILISICIRNELKLMNLKCKKQQLKWANPSESEKNLNSHIQVLNSISDHIIHLYY